MYIEDNIKMDFKGIE